MSTIQNFDPQIDLLSNIQIWQYDSSPKTSWVLQRKQEFYKANVSDFLKWWVVNVFTLKTANEFGLSVWAIILDQPLSYGDQLDPPGKPIFGFGSETDTPNTNQNFSNGNFTSVNGFTRWNTEEKRLILRLLYYTYISKGTITDANIFMSQVFEDFGYTGGVYFRDNNDMTVTLLFTTNPGWRIRLMLETYPIIVRPGGVALLFDWGA